MTVPRRTYPYRRTRVRLFLTYLNDFRRIPFGDFRRELYGSRVREAWVVSRDVARLLSER